MSQQPQPTWSPERLAAALGVDLADPPDPLLVPLCTCDGSMVEVSREIVALAADVGAREAAAHALRTRAVRASRAVVIAGKVYGVELRL